MRSIHRIFASVYFVLVITHSGLTVADEPVFLIGRQANWRFHAEERVPQKGWQDNTFDDSKWKIGKAGFGYGDGDDETVLTNMRGRFTSVAIRHSFDVKQPSDFGNLFLYVNYDDGFIAYLNGKQVAASRVAQDEKGEIRVTSHEAAGYEPFIIKDADKILVAGKNVLAIEGHNVDARSSDFSLDPVLMDRRLTELGAWIGVDGFLADLDYFEQRLVDQSSYLTRIGFDYQSALAKIRAKIKKRPNLAEYTLQLHCLVMQIGDCHAGVYSQRPWYERQFLPFRPADTADGLAALSVIRNRLIDADCPFVTSIDNVPIEKWIKAAEKYVVKGSPQLVRERSLFWMGVASLIRKDLGIENRETVSVGLRSQDGKVRRTKTLRLVRDRFSNAKVRLGRTRMLDGNIGYIRIPQMDNRLVASTVEHIKNFRDTDGLILDVRDNSGGTYAIMRAIFGFFVSENAKPHVTNISAYRLSKRFSEDHIAYRPTYRANWDGWTESERMAIRAAEKKFKPEWDLPQSKFSDWHYMVLSRQRNQIDGSRLQQPEPDDFFHYNKPVVVLSNASSFSATDGFLNAFASLPQVTIVGQPSGGGSGATRTFELPYSQLRIALSSMASFRANGKTFDGNGIEVDVAVKPSLADFLSDSDSVLERGIEVIRAKKR